MEERFMERRIRMLREERNMSQIKLAEEIGIPVRRLRAIELNTASLTADILIAMAKYFEVSTDYILGLVDKEGAIQDAITKEYLLNSLETLNENNREIVLKFMDILRENRH